MQGTIKHLNNRGHTGVDYDTEVPASVEVAPTPTLTGPAAQGEPPRPTAPPKSRSAWSGPRTCSSAKRSSSCRRWPVASAARGDCTGKRMALSKTAQERAENLLAEHLIPVQLTDWRTNTAFTIRGQDERLYRINAMHVTTNAGVVSQDGIGYGIWPIGLYIPADRALALKVLFEGDLVHARGAACTAAGLNIRPDRRLQRRYLRRQHGSDHRGRDPHPADRRLDAAQERQARARQADQVEQQQLVRGRREHPTMCRPTPSGS